MRCTALRSATTASSGKKYDFHDADRHPGHRRDARRALMKHFRTVRAVSEATVEMLEETPGMNAPAARAVYGYFHPRRCRSTTQNDGGKFGEKRIDFRFFRLFSAKTVDIFFE